MSLPFTLNRGNGSALYQQIAEQIKDGIGDGRLAAGSQLPTVRHLADSLGVTRLTVQNAYAELHAGGWVEATVGRGTFVSSDARPRSLAAANSKQPLTPDSVIRDILQADYVLGERTLASASPDPRLFPEEEFWRAISNTRSALTDLVSYSSSLGDPLLLTELAKLLAERGVDVATNEILITNGATQAFALLLQATCRVGDCVLVEQPTYVGFLNTARSLGVRPIGVLLDEQGPRIDMLERLIVQERPRFFYIVPTFQNPTGRSISTARRQELLTLAERYGLLLVEDDIFGRIAYDGPPPLALKAEDRSGLVVYISSVSKMFMPGLRLGYLVAPPPLHQRLLALRRAADLGGSPFLQRVLAEFLQQGGLKQHLKRVLPIYRQRRDGLMAALGQMMPHEVTWTRPTGGYTCWLTLPPLATMGDLYQAALQVGWAFAPGEVFLAEPDGQHYLRLAFGQASLEAIRHGVETLARLVRQRLEQPQHRQISRANDWSPLV